MAAGARRISEPRGMVIDIGGETNDIFSIVGDIVSEMVITY